MPPTLWTLILSAQNRASGSCEAALARICEIYWHPLYTFVYRQGFDSHRSEDLTQAFFEHLLSRPWLDRVDRQKGRFRTFLLCALCNFLNSEREKQRALKRGGAVRQFVSLDVEVYCQEDGLNPPTDLCRDFSREWARELVDKALKGLEVEYRRCGKLEVFNTLAPIMTRQVPDGYYAAQSARLNVTEAALRVAMHRITRRFGELLRAEVACTLADPALIDDELREIIQALARQ